MDIDRTIYICIYDRLKQQQQQQQEEVEEETMSKCIKYVSDTEFDRYTHMTYIFFLFLFFLEYIINYEGIYAIMFRNY